MELYNCPLCKKKHQEKQKQFLRFRNRVKPDWEGGGLGNKHVMIKNLKNLDIVTRKCSIQRGLCPPCLVHYVSLGVQPPPLLQKHPVTPLLPSMFILNDQAELRVETTEEKIDYEKLKIQERILFFDELVLYEVKLIFFFNKNVF